MIFVSILKLIESLLNELSLYRDNTMKLELEESEIQEIQDILVQYTN